MTHSEDLLNKISSLSEDQQKIARKLLDYVAIKEHSRIQIERLIKEDIREIVWEEIE